MTAPVLEAGRESGLVARGEPLLVMLSGGADSVCLLDVAVGLGAEVSVLHANYGLRPESDADEAFCRGLCSSMEIPLVVERVTLPSEGNLQALARAARYRVAERVAVADYATGHTASDQAETVLYRLATSPGRRALVGMEARRGRLVRPLLGVTREEVREHCRARGLDWREDASNHDPRFARARVRDGLLERFRAIGPASERSLAETARQLREEGEVLDEVVREAIQGLGGGPAVELGRLAELSPAVARLVLRGLAEHAAGDDRSLSRSDLDAVLGLGRMGSSSLDLGGGLRAVAEYGVLRFRVGGDVAPPAPVALAVPGQVAFGSWQLEASADGAGEVTIDARTVAGSVVVVRAWEDGDRMSPLGLGGSKSLQDLFTDRKVPRALRRSWPVVWVGEEIAWVPGVAVGEWFGAEGSCGSGAQASGASHSDVVGLTARRSV